MLVWSNNKASISRLINAVKNSFKLEDNFKLEAQNIFLGKFDKYYENDEKYLRFFYRCLVNFGKNKYRETVRSRKLITDIEVEDGKVVNIYDIIEDVNGDFINKELLPIEINELLKKSLDEVEYFVFLQVVEGWKKRDIAKMLECKTNIVEEIINKILREVEDKL